MIERVPALEYPLLKHVTCAKCGHVHSAGGIIAPQYWCPTCPCNWPHRKLH